MVHPYSLLRNFECSPYTDNVVAAAIVMLNLRCFVFCFLSQSAKLWCLLWGGGVSFTFLNGPSVTELISTSTLDNIPQERPLLVCLRGWLQLKPPAVIVNTDRFCLASIDNINNLFFFFKSVWIKCYTCLWTFEVK